MPQPSLCVGRARRQGVFYPPLRSHSLLLNPVFVQVAMRIHPGLTVVVAALSCAANARASPISGVRSP
jgi:hypothetical protein